MFANCNERLAVDMGAIPDDCVCADAQYCRIVQSEAFYTNSYVVSEFDAIAEFDAAKLLAYAQASSCINAFLPVAYSRQTPCAKPVDGGCTDLRKGSVAPRA